MKLLKSFSLFVLMSSCMTIFSAPGDVEASKKVSKGYDLTYLNGSLLWLKNHYNNQSMSARAVFRNAQDPNDIRSVNKSLLPTEEMRFAFDNLGLNVPSHLPFYLDKLEVSIPTEGLPLIEYAVNDLGKRLLQVRNFHSEAGVKLKLGLSGIINKEMKMKPTEYFIKKDSAEAIEVPENFQIDFLKIHDEKFVPAPETDLIRIGIES